MRRLEREGEGVGENGEEVRRELCRWGLHMRDQGRPCLWCPFQGDGLVCGARSRGTALFVVPVPGTCRDVHGRRKRVGDSHGKEP